ncbi:sodium channel protein Nach-like isoform X2 [Zootermopsis nevadensis]|uniref:sodium channel protein Nach-like isoform X2 n=1 Tax=Zootermopsis nevadensis TaxID=136037 RepID=UPI000B8E6ED7|nr:sodium channel protein Nach-like isoform X2 [Zootermopsis nevadensis]
MAMHCAYLKMSIYILKDFCNNSSIHGLKFITKPRRHWIERVFWVVCCALSWCGSFLLILSAWENNQNNAVSFVADTTYLDWNTPFISIAVFQHGLNSEVANSYIRNKFKKHEDGFVEEMRRLFDEIAFQEHLTLIHKCLDNTSKLNFIEKSDCPRTNLFDVVQSVRSPCKDIFRNCQWNGNEFDCCKYFLPLQTEMGPCYALNNIHTQNSSKSEVLLDMMSNRTTGPGKLLLELALNTKVYYLSKDEVPTFNTLSENVITATRKIFYKTLLQVTEVISVPDARSINIDKRQCKFPEENTGFYLYNWYSYSACLVECRRREVMRLCNCTNPLMPAARTEKNCDLDGMVCLEKNKDYINTLINPWDKREGAGISCTCMQGCEELGFRMVSKEEEREPRNYTTIEVQMVQLPTVRFKRNIVRNKVDMVVNMGGTAGLLVGGSILSVVEILYYFLVRPVWEAVHSHTSVSHTP